MHLERDDARRLLGRYHFASGTLAEVAHRLGSVQYDPLKPVGRNPDLTFQSRVPDYSVDDWQRAAYHDRSLYDAWDKQACLVLTEDWPYRRIYHRAHHQRWRSRIFDAYPEAVAATLDELARRGPLATADFDDQRSVGGWRGSWYGPKLIKNVLRALWDTGRVVTHHRDSGRHVYALPEQVLPAALVSAPEVDREASIDYLIARRVQSAGLLRPGADGALWFVPCQRQERSRSVERLLERGRLILLEVAGETYLTTPTALAQLDAPDPDDGVRFVAPLDPLLWDRRGVEALFGFSYVWEVYKPEAKRTWGYYVLPVWWRNRFLGRFDSRLEGTTFHLKRWWWEADVAVDAEALSALQLAFRRFTSYLGADSVRTNRSRRAVPSEVRDALEAAA